MGRLVGFKIAVRIILICSLLVGCLFLASKDFVFSAVFLFLVVLILGVEFYYFLMKPFTDVHKTLSAMLNEDFSLKAPSAHKNDVFLTLSDLYEKQKKSHFEQQSIQLIYNNLLNSISTGILILRKSDEEDWTIFLMNESFAQIFQMPVYTSWKNLGKNLPEFVAKLRETGFREVQQTMEISIDNQENQTYSLKTSKIKTYNYEYFTVSLDSVQSIIEKKEKQAWYDLMKVISHEMMNTLTPINSLVNSLQYFAEQESWDADDKKDFKESLETIQKKTIHMLEFVDNYRQLTNFPRPKKEEIDLVSLVKSCLEIMKPLLSENKIQVEFWSEKEEILSSIDQILTERVIINLLTNSIYALQEQETNREIHLKIYRQSHGTFVEIKDNGKGIDKEIRDKVFIPFFTTRQNGAGIGLSLSKNIMEAHSGYLTFKSKPGETVFVMSFL